MQFQDYAPDQPEAQAITFPTATLMVHHAKREVKTFSHDVITTNSDWQRVCSELDRIGATLSGGAIPDGEDEQGWMTWLGKF